MCVFKEIMHEYIQIRTDRQTDKHDCWLLGEVVQGEGGVS